MIDPPECDLTKSNAQFQRAVTWRPPLPRRSQIRLPCRPERHQGLTGVKPDPTTFAKAVANGRSHGGVGYRPALRYGAREMGSAASRNSAMLCDLCPMTKYHITVAEAEDSLRRLPFRNVSRLAGALADRLRVAPELARALWVRLVTAGAPHGLRPAGIEALNRARIEAGFLIATLDFSPAHNARREDRTRSRFDPGLGWVVDFDTRPFTRRRAPLAEPQTGARWARVGLVRPRPVAARWGGPAQRRKDQAGQIASAVWSPITEHSIALAEGAARHAGGHDLGVENCAKRALGHAKLMLSVTLTERPFFHPARKRRTPQQRV